MHEGVYRVLTLVSMLVVDLPIGTNLGLLDLFWMLLCGKRLLTRGAIFPGLSAVGLSEGAVRRAWVALGRGSWTSDRLVKSWARVVEAEGFWPAHRHGGYHPVAVDITAFYRPRLQACPTRQYSTTAGKALPAIPLGIIARVGSVGAQRFGLPRGLVRAASFDPSPSAHRRALLTRAVELQASDDMVVTDREFVLSVPKDGPVAGGRGHGLGPLKNAMFNLALPSTMRLYRLVFGHYWLSGYSFAIRRDVYLASGGFDPTLNAEEDLDLSFRVSRIARISFIDLPVTFSGRRFRQSLLKGSMEYLALLANYRWRKAHVQLRDVR